MWDYLYGIFGSEAQEEKDEAGELREYLIDKMQKKGDEILIQQVGKIETFFYAAQRLKNAKTFDTVDPCGTYSRMLSDKLVDLAKFSPVVVKRSNEGVREKIKYITDYLAEHVMRPDAYIDAYLTLLDKMEAAGEAPLIELEPLEKIKKSYKAAATDMKTFTSFKDKRRRQDDNISSVIRTNLKKLIEDDNLSGYNLAIMNQVINEQTDLLTTFLLADRDKTAALDVLLSQLEDNQNVTVLQHGCITRTCADALHVLHGVNAYELSKVVDADPIVSRKIYVRLANLIGIEADAATDSCDSNPLFTKVLGAATNYLAYHFIEKPIVKSCTCDKTVYKECDMDKEGSKRNVVRAYCRCQKQVGRTPLHMPTLQVSECPPSIRDLPCPGKDAGSPCTEN